MSDRFSMRQRTELQGIAGSAMSSGIGEAKKDEQHLLRGSKGLPSTCGSARHAKGVSHHADHEFGCGEEVRPRGGQTTLNHADTYKPL